MIGIMVTVDSFRRAIGRICGGSRSCVEGAGQVLVRRRRQRQALLLQWRQASAHCEAGVARQLALLVLLVGWRVDCVAARQLRMRRVAKLVLVLMRQRPWVCVGVLAIGVGAASDASEPLATGKRLPAWGEADRGLCDGVGHRGCKSKKKPEDPSLPPT